MSKPTFINQIFGSSSFLFSHRIKIINPIIHTKVIMIHHHIYIRFNSLVKRKAITDLKFLTGTDTVCIPLPYIA